MRDEILSVFEGAFSRIATRRVYVDDTIWYFTQRQFRDEVVGYVEEVLFPSE